MQLYHYASKQKGLFKELITERKRTSLIGKKLSLDFPSYQDHISFFFEKAPVDRLPGLYLKKGREHSFWKNGHVVYEYIVDTNKIKTPKKLFYKITETPDKSELILDDKVSKEEYDKLLEEIEKKHHYNGDSFKDLEKAWTDLNKRLGADWMYRSYEKMLNTKGPYGFEGNIEKYMSMYAPMVPHLMLYIEPGVINYIQVNEITMGDKRISQESTILTNWK